MRFYFRDDAPPTRDSRDICDFIEHGIQASRAYQEHLKQIAHRLPGPTRAFALMPWYLDPKSHDCPHDGWLHRVEVQASVKEDRQVGLSIVLLGAYHDRILKFTYSNVIKCRFDVANATGENVGGWLADEVDLVEGHWVSHSILWQKGNPWEVVAREVRFESKKGSPISVGGQGIKRVSFGPPSFS